MERSDIRKAAGARRMLHALFCMAVLALLPVAEAQARTGDWHDGDLASVRLLSAVEAVGDESSLQLGLEFQMEEGWKIYWRSPGDAGLPPEPDWSRSQNVADVAMGWPVPIRFSIFGLDTYGYEREVVFPLTVTPVRPGEPVALAGKVDYLICADICVPETAEISLSLPGGPGEPSAASHVINRYLSQVPAQGAGLGITVKQAAVRADGGDGFMLEVAVASAQPLQSPDVYIEGPAGSYFRAPEATFSADRSQAVLRAPGGGVDVAALTDHPLTLTVLDGGRAIETRVTPHSGSLDTGALGPAMAGSSAMALGGILLLALLGGLILNLMPCVLPVLSLKLLSVVGHGGGESRQVRIGFLASSAGIMASFLLLAGALSALQAAGASIGWGIQFQQPVFLAFMIVVLVLFAANMFGLFEFALPRRIADLASRRGGDGLTGHFLTGAFAALLATPCSAPFLGTAVGFALSRGPMEIVLVFAALGLGLAIPYLLVAAAPSLATRLPRPGPWMVKLKWLLGLALAATAVWLATVLASQAGVDAAISVSALAALAAAVLWTRRIEGSRLGRHAAKVSVVLAVAALAAPVFGPQTALAPRGADRLAAATEWERFDRTAIAPLIAEGKVVLVDVTADWCITCQFNKANVLDRGRVAELLGGSEVVAMQADWTRPDPEIARFLAAYGRYGIPFNIVYGPGNPDGVPLPELLTESAVLSAIAEASGGEFVAGR